MNKNEMAASAISPFNLDDLRARSKHWNVSAYDVERCIEEIDHLLALLSSDRAVHPEEWTALDGSLTIRFLQYINAKRAVRWHQNGGIKSWSALEWAGAMAGEAGEACNAAKKLKRIEDQIANINLEEGRSLTDEQNASAQVVDEIADTVIYGVLLAERVGLDLEEAIRMKFNRKSEEYGFPERIPANAPPAELASDRAVKEPDHHESRSPDGDGPLLARNAEHDNAPDDHNGRPVERPIEFPPAFGGRCGQPTPGAGFESRPTLTSALAAEGLVSSPASRSLLERQQEWVLNRAYEILCDEHGKTAAYSIEKAWTELPETLRLADVLQKGQASKECQWAIDDKGGDSVYETNCGHNFYFDDSSGAGENGFRFCAYCGGHLVEVKTSEEKDDH